jgi:hypothetical protein
LITAQVNSPLPPCTRRIELRYPIPLDVEVEKLFFWLAEEEVVEEDVV